MRILITTLLLCISAVLFAQVPTSFQGTLNIYQSSGASPNYEIRGVFNDTQGRYTADSADVGDKIFILDGANCVELEITSIISTTGGILRCNVTDIDAVLVNPPLATGAIMEPTPRYGFPTFVDGISNDLLACIRTYFTLLVDDIASGGITGIPGNTQDTVVQVGHGLSLLDPVFVNASGNWILSNISDEDSCHMAIVTEVISADTLILTYNGLTQQPSHGYTVGSVYFVQDDGTYATTVPTNFINDIAFYVVSDSTLYITEQRPVSPMTDLNGIYSSSDTIPDGTIATADEFAIRGKTNSNYEFKFWPSNDNIYIKSDSVLLTFSSSEAVFRDYKTVPTGIEYNGNGYVTNPLSLTTKEYVDSMITTVEIPDGDKGDITVSGSGTIWNIDANTIESSNIVDGTISSDDIGTGQVLTGEILNGTILAEDIASGQIASTHIIDETIQASDIDTNAVTSSEILDGTILTTDLAFTVNGGSGVTNQVTYWSGTNTLAADVDFTFDGTNVGIGTTPIASTKLAVQGDGATSSTVNFLAENSSGTDLFLLRDDGTILNRYLGTTPMSGAEPTTAQLSINKQMTAIFPSTSHYGIHSHVYLNTPTGGNTYSELYGIVAQAGNRGGTGGYVRNLVGGYFEAYTNQAAQVGQDIFALRANISNISSSIVGAYGAYITLSNSGTLTNTYGLLIGDVTSGTQTNQAYSIYASDINARNAIFGNTGIGTADPTANLDVNGSGRFRAIATPGSVEDGETWTNSTQKTLVSNQAGVTQSINGTLFTGSATITVNNTVSETTLIPSGTGTVTLPANFWTVGKTLEITAYGDWRTDTVPSTLELRMELGGTLLCTTSAQTMVATEGAQWKATATITCRSTGVTGTTMSEGELRMNSDASTSVIYQMYRSATNTINTTTSSAFDITVTHGAADPFNEMRLHTLTIKVLN